jgi:prevent-host-death family protein
MTSIPITDAKNNLTRIIHEVEDGSPIELTRHGKPAAVIISVDEYKGLKKDNPSFTRSFSSFTSRHTEFLEEKGIFDGIRSADTGREVSL